MSNTDKQIIIISLVVCFLVRLPLGNNTIILINEKTKKGYQKRRLTSRKLKRYTQFR